MVQAGRGWIALCAVLVVITGALLGLSLVRTVGARLAWTANCSAVGGHVITDVPTTLNPLVADGATLTDRCVDDNGFVLASRQR